MSCDYSGQIHRYHDGELSEDQFAGVEVHLRDCAGCRELLADLQRLSSAIGHAVMAAPSPGMAERLEGSWAAARNRGVIRFAGWLTAAAAAAAVAVMFVRPGSERLELAAQSSVWETIATTPPAETQEDYDFDLTATAPWVGEDLSQGSI